MRTGFDAKTTPRSLASQKKYDKKNVGSADNQGSFAVFPAKVRGSQQAGLDEICGGSMSDTRESVRQWQNNSTALAKCFSLALFGGQLRSHGNGRL